MKFSQYIFEGYRQEMEAEQRRENNEWELGPDCPHEGKLAWALLYYLSNENELEILSSDDKIKKEQLELQIEELNTQYNELEGEDEDLLEQISELEEELDELNDKCDVYDMIPIGNHYELTLFEVPKKLGDNHYASGDEDEVIDSAKESIGNLIDDVGFKGFSKSFVSSHLDEEKIVDYFREYFEEDVYNNPEAYFEDDQRELSTKQEEKVEILEEKISRTEDIIETLQERFSSNETKNSSIEDKIQEFLEYIEEMKDEIEEIKDNPEGDFPEELFEHAIDNRLYDVRSNPEHYLHDFGLELDEFIDRDDFIDAVLDADGYGHNLSTYDGTIDEIDVMGETFWVCRID